MTANDFCYRLKYMALNRESFYSNSFPKNCLYINNGGVLSADCIGMIKSLINEPDAYKRTSPVGYYVKPSQVIPDTTEKGILNLCSDVTSNFNKLVAGEYLYMDGHAGIYVGEFTDGSGTVNVIECTPAFGGGITTSYVSGTGTRFNHKGGSSLGKWQAHGKLTKYIEYAKPVLTWIKKWYLYEDGVLVKGWKKFDDDWYYLSETDGVMLIGWQKLKWSGGTNWFYFEPSGAMVTGWQKLKWSGGTNWFYFEPSGAMVTGTKVIDGKTYKFDDNGCWIEN